MHSKLRTLLLSAACAAALSAQAQAASQLDIPAGSLDGALQALSRQTGAQLLYRPEQLAGLQTRGVRGELSPAQAAERLLEGSGLVARRDASGALLIARQDATPRPAPGARPKPAPAPQADSDAPTDLERLQVTGSRIPRAQVEGPAPITTITAEDIKAKGFTTVPDVLRAITQNGGETQSQQSANGADFSPGAQQVDLRGLGPNHTLVLVNGRRIADFPLPFKGRSNFTDISNIPLGMIERIEILSGSASAVYGSDAISGVVNFILKKHADGTTVDYRFGTTSRGDADSFDLSISSGFERGAFSAVYGLEYTGQNPLWAYQRGIQDSSQDSPVASGRIARRGFLRTDYYDTYLDPGRDTCEALARFNGHSTYYASRPRYGDYDPALDDYGPGYYCGSDKAIGYGTIISKREGLNAYGSFNYDFGDGLRWFADVQAGYHTIDLFRDVRSWSYQQPNGQKDGYFYNQATEQVEYWQRQFTPEEMGGLNTGTVRNRQKTFSLTTGLAGRFGQAWDWEASLSHSQYSLAVSWPQIVASKANDLFLGTMLGIDEDSGYPIYNADPARLYTPLTRAEYDGIFARSTYHPESRNDTLAFTLTNTALFGLPGGPAGLSATAELGSQGYDLKPDPLATQDYYYSWKDSDGHGSRNRWAVASELRLPLLERLNLSLAGRFDQYRFAGRSIDKPTWSAGVEWRPIDALLLRGSYGTAFRAPDLHYLFAQEGEDETSGVDYYRCDTEEAGTPYEDCSYGDEGIVRTRVGNRDLKPETSTAWTAGLVFSPTPSFDISLDWFDIDMRDQVQDLRVDVVLRNERDCLTGAVPLSSGTCVDALSRVTRLADGKLYGVSVEPINIARERTSGADLAAHWKLDTGLGLFTLGLDYTWVHRHDIQVYAGDPMVDEFAINSGYDIPRTKTSASLGWSKAAWSATVYGQRLGKLPNYASYDQDFDEDSGQSPWVEATWRYNLSLSRQFGDRARLSLTVNNVLDKMPPKDASYTAYPYYDVSWFDSLGRSLYLDFTYKFGGKAL
ncbi:TonB-dependent receptor [Pseudoxanthomonas winnipegensis]|uniref:TonB-dependent receptor n=1 Tax=Pseudoxanthomonas winnipegensis TaxID=2480810 RepID=A0A4Q8L9U8_9GAMM|nr:TonB-dependent receptor [Pseudoxanthomonas winnipegensis]RZZ81592.1 TonB-dependent receptor [Pseudoxanthomonas winnipegensis]TAA24706.1 TonB-dependent receptor [Pseudoxanthomonas winnipegensis]TAA39958.1 TonB-dependent receptor [Pseudoxanthomonas winnipegensis]TBV74586.1 TonB-dependent receptor [Pseudoxanthomonas winnipegensis]